MQLQFGHERLKVYQYGLRFVSWKEALIQNSESNAEVLDHLDRAGDSIVESIANGNSRRAQSDRNRYFDIALGSVLECAACLDICACCEIVTVKQQIEGKLILLSIVRMTIRLREATGKSVYEEDTQYGGVSEPSEEILFDHEKLEVYKRSLGLVKWTDSFIKNSAYKHRLLLVLEKASVGLVLNIAEGNGRHGYDDHKHFLDIAHSCAMKVAATLDLLVAKNLSDTAEIVKGKQMLYSILPLLMGLRGYFAGTSD